MIRLLTNSAFGYDFLLSLFHFIRTVGTSGWTLIAINADLTEYLPRTRLLFGFKLPTFYLILSAGCQIMIALLWRCILEARPCQIRCQPGIEEEPLTPSPSFVFF